MFHRITLFGFLPPPTAHYPQQDRQHHTQHHRSRRRKINGSILPAIHNIPRQPPQRNIHPPQCHHHGANHHQHHSKNNQHFSQFHQLNTATLLPNTSAGEVQQILLLSPLRTRSLDLLRWTPNAPEQKMGRHAQASHLPSRTFEPIPASVNRDVVCFQSRTLGASI
jgi:hypothetical protein